LNGLGNILLPFSSSDTYYRQIAKQLDEVGVPYLSSDAFQISHLWKCQLSLGNVNDISLMDIWKGIKLLSLRLSLLKNNAVNPCSVCDFQRVSQNDNIDSLKEDIIIRLGN